MAVAVMALLNILALSNVSDRLLWNHGADMER